MELNGTSLLKRIREMRGTATTTTFAGRLDLSNTQALDYSDNTVASLHTAGGFSADKAIWTQLEMALTEMSAPTGTSDIAKIFAQDNGSGKTQLMVIFGSGVAQQISIEP